MLKKLFSFSILLVIIFTSFGSTLKAYASTPATVQANVVLAYTNAERYKIGRPLLTSNDTLSRVAREKMLDLFARQYFAHESPSGESVSDLAKKAGYKYIVVGENLAMGDFSTSKSVVEAWMDSPGHKKNILSETYSEIGISAGRGIYEGRNIWMIVQSFGYPNSKCPVVSASYEAKLDAYDRRLTILSSVAEKRKKALTESRGTREERQALVDSYNIAARLYNSVVEDYKDYADEYNKKVNRYNACVKKITSKLD